MSLSDLAEETIADLMKDVVVFRSPRQRWFVLEDRVTMRCLVWPVGRPSARAWNIASCVLERWGWRRV